MRAEVITEKERALIKLYLNPKPPLEFALHHLINTLIFKRYFKSHFFLPSIESVLPDSYDIFRNYSQKPPNWCKKYSSKSIRTLYKIVNYCGVYSKMVSVAFLTFSQMQSHWKIIFSSYLLEESIALGRLDARHKSWLSVKITETQQDVFIFQLLKCWLFSGIIYFLLRGVSFICKLYL